ncbi:MAG: DUF2541 family protein [Cytophagales bacterium]|nr:MAG: DUF2541 family protein [Cytophagales bacterium]
MKSSLIISLTAIVLLFSAFSAPPAWVRLGSRLVNYGLDRDVIQVNRVREAFTALRIQVRRGGINLHRLEVVFENGERQEIEVRHQFRAGSESRQVDLNGNRRNIDKIIFWYDTKNIARGKAVITVLARR